MKKIVKILTMLVLASGVMFAFANANDYSNNYNSKNNNNWQDDHKWDNKWDRWDNDWNNNNHWNNNWNKWDKWKKWREYTPNNCRVWYDGCNTCTRQYEGGPLVCTKVACFTHSQAYCKDYFDWRDYNNWNGWGSWNNNWYNNNWNGWNWRK